MDYNIQPVTFYADFNHPINVNPFTESPTTMWIDVFGIHYALSRQNKKKHWFFQTAIKDHRLMEAQASFLRRPLHAHERIPNAQSYNLFAQRLLESGISPSQDT